MSSVLTTAKIAVLAPIPSARAATATAVKASDPLSSRTACFRSCSVRSMRSLVPKRDDRIDRRCAASWTGGGCERDQREQARDRSEAGWIGGSDREQLGAKETGQGDGTDKAERKADARQGESVADNQGHQILRARAQRHADANFAAPLGNRIT